MSERRPQLHDEQRADQLGALWREGVPPARDGDAERERFLRTEVRAAHPARRYAALALAALLIGAIAVAWWLPRLGAEAPLDYRATHLAQQGAVWTLEDADTPGALRFEDGSEIALVRGALQLASVDADGATIILDQGHLSAEITHTSTSDWQVETAGGTVYVTGTRFDVDWDHGVLQVELHEGSVRVEVVGYPDPVALEAGHGLWVNVLEGPLTTGPLAGHGPGVPHGADDALRTPQRADAEVLAAASVIERAIDTARAAEAVPAPARADQQPLASSRHDDTRRSAQREAPVVPAPASSPVVEAAALAWPDAVQRGEYAEVVMDAERGLEASLTTRPVDDLVALAEAARYTRRHDVAYAAQRALRDRFPAASAGRDAAFFLGRHYERERQWTEAAQWYATYLEEVPRGAYATQALGRRMTVLNEAGQTDAARSLAASYLELDADGPFAEAATRLLEAP